MAEKEKISALIATKATSHTPILLIKFTFCVGRGRRGSGVFGSSDSFFFGENRSGKGICRIDFLPGGITS